MTTLAYGATVSFLAVFLGLLILWSAMRVLPLRQRLVSAVIAGGVSALVTVVVKALAAG